MFCDVKDDVCTVLIYFLQENPSTSKIHFNAETLPTVWFRGTKTVLL